MPWFRLEDSFHLHPKVLAAGNAATGLWVRCGTWSAQYLTDGFVPAEIVTNYGRPREAAAAVSARLWVPTDGGMLMPDYLEYNPSKSDVVQRRKADAERKRRGRDAVDRAGNGQFAPRNAPDPFR